MVSHFLPADVVRPEDYRPIESVIDPISEPFVLSQPASGIDPTGDQGSAMDTDSPVEEETYQSNRLASESARERERSTIV